MNGANYCTLHWGWCAPTLQCLLTSANRTISVSCLVITLHVLEIFRQRKNRNRRKTTSFGQRFLNCAFFSNLTSLNHWTSRGEWSVQQTVERTHIQCPAVNTQHGLIRVPPHTCLKGWIVPLDLNWTEACHGWPPGSDFIPPYMRLIGFLGWGLPQVPNCPVPGRIAGLAGAPVEGICGVWLPGMSLLVGCPPGRSLPGVSLPAAWLTEKGDPSVGLIVRLPVSPLPVVGLPGVTYSEVSGGVGIMTGWIIAGRAVLGFSAGVEVGVASEMIWSNRRKVSGHPCYAFSFYAFFKKCGGILEGSLSNPITKGSLSKKVPNGIPLGS